MEFGNTFSIDRAFVLRYLVAPEKAEIFIDTWFYAVRKNCSTDEVIPSRDSSSQTRGKKSSTA